MRYGIIEHHEDGDDSPCPYFVVDSAAATMGAGMLGPKYSEAEAKIIAFALSAIQSGLVLAALEPGVQGTLFAKGFAITTYDDTTKGIV